MHRIIGWLGAVACLVFALPAPASAGTAPASAHAAAGLSITSVDLYTKQPTVLTVTLDDPSADVTITIPTELRTLMTVRRPFGTCTGGAGAYTCTGGDGYAEVVFGGGFL